MGTPGNSTCERFDAACRLSLAIARQAALTLGLVLLPGFATAGEGGTSHVMPGANATLVDLPPTSPGGFVKPMFINYRGDASAKVPTAAGVVANLNADADTFVLGGGYGFEETVLGGAHYSVAAFLPYTWLTISGNSAALGGVQIQNSVSGLGDLTAGAGDAGLEVRQLAVRLPDAGLCADGQLRSRPTGQHGPQLLDLRPDRRRGLQQRQDGARRGRPPGLRDQHREQRHPTTRAATSCTSTRRCSRSFRSVPGWPTSALEAWYFQQVTCDSGAGATLGCFKGRTAGIGPVLGYIQPIGNEKLLFELKWLPELDTKNRLKGDYVWLKMVYTF